VFWSSMSFLSPIPISLYDSYLKRQVALDPAHTTVKNTLKIYSCGPTVYNYQSIGNMRAVFLPDTLAKVAKIGGWNVEWALNITDVGHLVGDGDRGEDKVEKMARESGNTVDFIVQHYTQDYRAQCAALHFNLPTGILNPRASDYIEEQMQLALLLVQRGLAYSLSDGIYFDYHAFRLHDDWYATLPVSLRNMLESADNPQANADRAFSDREIVNTQKDPRDFALWKFVDVDTLQKWRFMDFASAMVLIDAIPVVQFDTVNTKNIRSNWGCPGWHSECVVMICKTLGSGFLPQVTPNNSVIDVHTGGEDHIDIHHKNEILQSTALGFSLSKYWVHNKFVMVDGTKMSKSLGNVYLVTGKKAETGFESIQERGFDALSYRLLLLEHSYDTQMNFTWDKLTQAQTRLHGLRKLAAMVEGFATTQDLVATAFDAQPDNTILQTLCNNLNTPLFLEQYSQLLLNAVNAIRTTNSITQTQYDELIFWEKHLLQLDLFGVVPAAVHALASTRNEAKISKDYAQADTIRTQITSLGYEVDDYAFGSGVWKR